MGRGGWVVGTVPILKWGSHSVFSSVLGKGEGERDQKSGFLSFFFFLNETYSFLNKLMLNCPKRHMGQIEQLLEPGATSLRPLPYTVDPPSMSKVIFIVMVMLLYIVGGVIFQVLIAQS